MQQKNLIYYPILLVLFLFSGLSLLSQERGLPSHSVVKVTETNQLKSAQINWDYYNNFQDTTALNEMILENIDGSDDSTPILVGLGLDFSQDAWLLLHFTGETNYWAGSNSSFDTLVAADRWMITPPIIVSNWSSLAWKALSVNIGGTPSAESYEIYLSTTPVLSSSDFPGTPLFAVAEESNTWTEHVVDLSDFYGDTIQIGIRHTSFNEALLAIDDLRIGYIHNPEGGMLGDFENVVAFSTDLSPWTTLDLDSSATYVLQGVSFPGSGGPLSFVPFNPEATSPSLSGIDVYEGDQFGAVFSAVAGPFGNAPNNDWLISPKAPIDPNGKVSFYAKSFSHLWGLERFRVGISTGNPYPEEFIFISPGAYVEVDTVWTYFQYDLSLWEDQDIYIGINCISDTAFIFCIDDIRIDSMGNSISIHPFQLNELELFPNPSRGIIHINRIEDSKISVYDTMGRTHFELASAGYKNQIDLSHLPNGTYIVQIIRNEETIRKKIQIIH